VRDERRIMAAVQALVTAGELGGASGATVVEAGASRADFTMLRAVNDLTPHTLGGTAAALWSCECWRLPAEQQPHAGEAAAGVLEAIMSGTPAGLVRRAEACAGGLLAVAVGEGGVLHGYVAVEVWVHGGSSSSGEPVFVLAPRALPRLRKGPHALLVQAAVRRCAKCGGGGADVEVAGRAVCGRCQKCDSCGNRLTRRPVWLGSSSLACGSGPCADELRTAAMSDEAAAALGAAPQRPHVELEAAKRQRIGRQAGTPTCASEPCAVSAQKLRDSTFGQDRAKIVRAEMTRMQRAECIITGRERANVLAAHSGAASAPHGPLIAGAAEAVLATVAAAINDTAANGGVGEGVSAELAALRSEAHRLTAMLEADFQDLAARAIKVCDDAEGALDDTERASAKLLASFACGSDDESAADVPDGVRLHAVQEVMRAGQGQGGGDGGAAAAGVPAALLALEARLQASASRRLPMVDVGGSSDSGSD
jgi:hypothetical protein